MPYAHYKLFSQVSQFLLTNPATKDLIYNKENGKSRVILYDKGGVIEKYKYTNLMRLNAAAMCKRVADLDCPIGISNCVSPISQYSSYQTGIWIPLVQHGISYLDFQFQGKKPWESILFPSVVPGGDSMMIPFYCIFDFRQFGPLDQSYSLRSAL